MKAYHFLLPALLATTAAIADAQSTQEAAQGVEQTDADIGPRVLGHHPAVLISKSWSSRGIDTNTLALSHPALLPRAKSQHAAAVNERARENRRSSR
jgi:hypothetical protein